MSNVTRFGAVGDGVVDDTESIRHAVNEGDGMLHFPPGTYRITQPIEVRLAKRTSIGCVMRYVPGGKCSIPSPSFTACRMDSVSSTTPSPTAPNRVTLLIPV